MKDAKFSFSIAAALGFALALPPLFAQAADRPSDVLGLAFVGHQVSDLERSIKFFEAIDFQLVEGPGNWIVDKELNKLGNTPGAESRTAVMRVQSSVSDVPFTFVLRQYQGHCAPGLEQGQYLGPALEPHRPDLRRQCQRPARQTRSAEPARHAGDPGASQSAPAGGFPPLRLH